MVRQLERWAPLGGIVFVVLMVVGTYLVADVSDPHAPQQEITDYLADSDNHTRNIIGAYMWVLGALLFLWFVARLRSVLREAEGDRLSFERRLWSGGDLQRAHDGFRRGLRRGWLCRRVAGCDRERA
jgi:hypothetical protein